jgi:hypothetical protein
MPYRSRGNPNNLLTECPWRTKTPLGRCPGLWGTLPCYLPHALTVGTMCGGPWRIKVVFWSVFLNTRITLHPLRTTTSMSEKMCFPCNFTPFHVLTYIHRQVTIESLTLIRHSEIIGTFFGNRQPEVKSSPEHLGK